MSENGGKAAPRVCLTSLSVLAHVQEAEMLRSISFHPSGDFLLVGTQHPTLRLYDINTFQCFVSCNPLDQHTDTISSVNYNPTANSYVTCSKDGSVKLWDGVSNRCVSTFEKAHDGAEVCSAIFSKNSKYILSSGKDSVVKLWEISTGRTLVKYTGRERLLQLVTLVITLVPTVDWLLMRLLMKRCLWKRVCVKRFTHKNTVLDLK